MRSATHSPSRVPDVRFSPFNRFLEDVLGGRGLGRLTQLGLRSCSLDDTSARILASTPRFGQLRVIDLRDNLITDKGAKALAAAGPGKLELLELGGNMLTVKGRDLLNARFPEARIEMEGRANDPQDCGDRPPRLDARRRARGEALAALAADRRHLPAAGASGRSARADRATGRIARRAARDAGRRRHRAGLAGDRGAPARTRARESVGLRARSTPRSTTSREAYPWKPRREDYYVHITTGTHVAQICLFLLCETRAMPAQLLQTSPRRDGRESGPGQHRRHRSRSRAVRPPRGAVSRAQQREGTSFLKAGHRHAQRGVQPADRRARAGRDRARAIRCCSTGPTGAGKIAAVRGASTSSSSARQQLAGELVEVNCATLRGDGAMSALFGHAQGRVHRRAPRRARACCARPTAGCCSSTRSASSASTSRRCCCARSRRSGSSASAPTSEVDERLPADRRHQPRSRGRRARGAIPRGPARAHRPVDVPAARRCASGARTSSRTSTTSSSSSRAELGRRVSFSREARERVPALRDVGRRRWPANFRDFNAAIARMATLAAGGRIDAATVDDEIARLRDGRAERGRRRPRAALLGSAAPTRSIASIACSSRTSSRCAATAPSLSEAGRALFAQSLAARRRSTNDADRLRKYLARFGLSFEHCAPGELP